MDGIKNEAQHVIDVVELKSLNEIVEIKDNWEKVHHSDSHSHLFTTWAWLISFFEATQYEWIVLAAREQNSQEYVAFFPIVIQQSSRGLIRTIHLGGFPVADYSGFICLPGYEAEAIKSISEVIKDNLAWDRFRMDDVLDDRLELIVHNFPGDQFFFEERPPTPCPYISLPGSFEEYLASLGRSTRQTMRRRIRKMEKVEAYRASDASKDDLDLHIDIAIELWQKKWGPAPLEFKALFQRCYANKCLWLRVLWISDVPIAAMVGKVDPVTKYFSLYITAFDPTHQQLSPGRVLLSQSIRYAIEQGMETYDFLRGGEPYKYSLGAKDRFTNSAHITRKNFKNAGIMSIKKILKTFSH